MSSVIPGAIMLPMDTFTELWTTVEDSTDGTPLPGCPGCDDPTARNTAALMKDPVRSILFTPCNHQFVGDAGYQGLANRVAR